MAKLNVVQDKYGFLSNKWFPSKNCTIAKGKTYPKCGKCEYFATASKSKPQSSVLNWLQNKSFFDEEYYFTINSPLAEATFAFTNALPKEFLIDSGSSVNIINYDAFKKLESLISMTLEKSFFRIYPYGCKTPYQYLESVLLKVVRNVPTRELSQDFMSLTLQHCVFLANLGPSCFGFRCSWTNQVCTNFYID